MVVRSVAQLRCCASSGPGPSPPSCHRPGRFRRQIANDDASHAWSRVVTRGNAQSCVATHGNGQQMRSLVFCHTLDSLPGTASPGPCCSPLSATPPPLAPLMPPPSSRPCRPYRPSPPAPPPRRGCSCSTGTGRPGHGSWHPPGGGYESGWMYPPWGLGGVAIWIIFQGC